MIDFAQLEQIDLLEHSLHKPRLLYRKGIMAAGRFQPYMSFAEETKADFLGDSEKETLVVVRFSKASGEVGGADSLRDSRGFCVRFFTEEGNYDLIGHNFPIFYFHHAADFLKWIRSMLPGKTGMQDRMAHWNFLREHPEAIGMTLGLFSNAGTIRSYRTMRGYGIGTQQWISAAAKQREVRYRWIPLRNGEAYEDDAAGISDQEAEFLAGFEPDCAARDLYEAMEAGIFPVYELQVQLAEKEKLTAWCPEFRRATIYWPEALFPWIRAGRMELTELLTEGTETFCFRPSNLVPGICWGDRDFFQVMDYILRRDGMWRGGNV